MRIELKKKVKEIFHIVTGCSLLYKTEWYRQMFVSADHETYPDNIWYRNHEIRNFDVVNLGSSGGKWAFDYTDAGVKGMNWAQQPQTLLEDYNLLRHFHSILRKGGFVIITIMPFTGLNKDTGIVDAMKYLKIETQGEPIQPYLFNEATRYAEYPILFGKPALKALAKYLLGKERSIKSNTTNSIVNNPMQDVELQHDASMWISLWMNQFSISDFDAPLTNKNQEGRLFRVKLMRNIIDFCCERGYHPVWVIPPVTEYLYKFFTPKFRQTYIYDYLNQVDRDIPLLDYLDYRPLMNKDFYFNSFFMNLRGRKEFTRYVLEAIHLI